MILIIGGAYQGKLDYAESVFLLSPEEIFTCTGTEIDFSKRCINALEEFCYACVQKGIDPVAFFREHEDAWQDSILICNDLCWISKKVKYNALFLSMMNLFCSGWKF